MIDTGMQFGNCKSKALDLQRDYGGTIKTVSQGRFSPRHYLVKLQNGEWWHFRKVAYVFPWPFCYLSFVGKYEKLGDRP